MNEKFYGWHLLSIKPNCYKIAEGNLNRQGCNVFIPKHMITIRKGNRFLDQLQPLFPGYVFAEISKHSCDVRVLNNTRGVNKIVSLTGNYYPIETALIESLRSHFDNNKIFSFEASFKVGDQIKIESGPFTSLIAKIVRAQSHSRVELLLEFLGRSVRMTTSTSSISHAKA